MILLLLLAAAPLAPQLTLAPQRYTVAITWPADPSALAIEIEVSEPDGEDWWQIALVEARPAEFIAHALPPGAQLDFRARAWNRDGGSEWSATAHTATLPMAPVRVAGPGLSRCYDEKVLRTDARTTQQFLGDEDAPECRAATPEVTGVDDGALHLLLVDPIAPDCHGNGGAQVAAFARIAGCLRYLGVVPDYIRPMEVRGASVPPLRSSWHMSAADAAINVYELRRGKLVQVDGVAAVNTGLDRPFVLIDHFLDSEVLRGVPGAEDIYTGE